MSYTNQMTRDEVARLAAHSLATVSLYYCAAQHLLGRCVRYGFSAGRSGWRYDVFILHGVIITTGYATIAAYVSDDANRITKRYERISYMLDDIKHYERSLKRFPDYKSRADYEERLYSYLRLRWTRELIRAAAQH